MIYCCSTLIQVLASTYKFVEYSQSNFSQINPVVKSNFQHGMPRRKVDHKIFVPAIPILLEECLIYQSIYAACTSVSDEEWIYKDNSILPKPQFHEENY